MTGSGLAPIMVDQQVVGDHQQPGANVRPSLIEAAPRAKCALEGELRQVFNLLARAEPVAEESVDIPDVLVVRLRKCLGRLPTHGASDCVERPLHDRGATCLTGRRLSGPWPILTHRSMTA